MTSIEWLINCFKTEYNSKEVWLEKFDQAKEMHKQEMEISDEKIKKAANNPNNDGYCFQEGAKWYREQLKQPKKD